MSTVTDKPRAAGQAALATEVASEKAGVEVRELSSLEDAASACSLFNDVWEVGDKDSLMPTNLARAMSHAESYFAGAFAGGQVMGAVLGFVGFRDGMHLHSHVLAVRPGAQRGGIGFALKQHQRGWALAHRLDPVRWTFDPLVRRNAYFNLCKLGAEIVEYHVNFYGEMTDGLNTGDESDRVMVRWRLGSERAVDASQRGLGEPDVPALLAAGAEIALDEDSNGTPQLSDTHGRVILCRIPPDVVALRRTDPDLALSWRRALRDSMGGALSNGYVATGISKSGWYVLERNPELTD